ncbi:MAG: molybdopterin cofactor-binding domain-containing protein [Acetobacteraceae bacterium]|nr:molybdopterin cofactor-binding domain-containing protein [Acetobacteraceae bacterium]
MPDSPLPEAGTAGAFIGLPLPRLEDPPLLTGRGRYTDDVALPGQLFAQFVRSPHAHGVIRAIDAGAAAAMPGVVAIITGADLVAAGYGTLRCTMAFTNKDGSPMRGPERPPLATDKVRFVGDPVVCVVAESRGRRRATRRRRCCVDIEPLPAVTEASAAAAPGAPVPCTRAIRTTWCSTTTHGDRDAVAAAFAEAAHVVRLPLRNNRVVVCAMEPRAAVAEYDARGERFVLHVGSQGVWGLRNQLADDLLRVPRERVRVLTGHVGGSFGMKASAYPEYVALLHAAKLTGRPVKWTDERTGSFVSDQHGRDHEVVAELALDAEGRFLAVRLTAFANMGAYLGTVAPLMGTLNFVKNVQSVYATPLIEVATRCVVTNTSPVSAYRGAGRPEGNYFMERLIEEAARVMGIDAVDLRRRNHIAGRCVPASDGGRNGLRQRGFRSHPRPGAGRCRLGGFPGPPGGGRTAREAPGAGHRAISRMHRAAGEGDGRYPFRRRRRRHHRHRHARLRAGPSHELRPGSGRGARRAAGADPPAAGRLGRPDRGRRHGGLEVVDGLRVGARRGGGDRHRARQAGSRAPVRGGGGRHRLRAKAASALSVRIVPSPCSISPPCCATGVLPARACPPRSMSITCSNSAPSAYPNGCHVAEVEIDPATGVVEVVSYVSRQRLRHGGEPADRGGPGAGRRGARHRSGAVRAGGVRLRRASSCRAASWTTRCRARRTCRRSASRTIRCRRARTGSARRAAARRAARAPCRR